MTSKTYVRITAIPLSSRMEPIKLRSTAHTEWERRGLYADCFVTRSDVDEPMEEKIQKLLCNTGMCSVEYEFIRNLRDRQVAVIFKLEEIRKTKRKCGLINKKIRKVSICPYALTYTMASPYNCHEYIRELTDVTLLRRLVRSGFSNRFDMFRMPNLGVSDILYLFDSKSMLHPRKGYKSVIDDRLQVKALTIDDTTNTLVSGVVHEPFQTLDDWFPFIRYMPNQDILSLFGKIYQITETHKRCLVQLRICLSISELEQFRIMYGLYTNYTSPICIRFENEFSYDSASVPLKDTNNGSIFVCFLIQGIDIDGDLKAYPCSDLKFFDPVKTIQMCAENGTYIVSTNQGDINIIS